MRDYDFLQNDIILEDMQYIESRNIDWNIFDKKVILITGAYGMLASYITYFLIYLTEIKKIKLNLIVAVRNIDKLKERFGNYIKKDYFNVYNEDITMPINIDENIDYIIHAASLASPQYYSVCPIEVLTPNVIGNYQLLNLAVDKKIKGFLLFSTGDIYGRVTGVDKITEVDYGIVDTLDIHSCYGESKRMAETMCKAWYCQKSVPIKIARICHTYGPTMDVKNDPRVFASFVNDVMNNRNIIMKSDGTTKRSFCYITDAVVGYFKILLDGKLGEAYNVCNSNEFISIRELAEIIINIYPEKNLKIIITKREVDDVYLENNKANDIPICNKKLIDLEWNCNYNCNEGFKRTINALSLNDNQLK